MATSRPLLREGYLLKRQRGKSPNADLKKLKFQQRYIKLDEKTLDYFDQKKGTKRGSFPVEKIKIIEVVPDETFGKSFYFQVGDEEEVMYFRAKSDKSRKEWMEAFRIACITLNKNEMCDWYHTGAFGKFNARWSCCCAEKRESKGCRKTTIKLPQRYRLGSLTTQLEHDSPSVENRNIAEQLSTSMPTGHSSTCNWGDEEVLDEIEYQQSPETEDSEISTQKDFKYQSTDSGLSMGNTLRVGTSSRYPESEDDLKREKSRLKHRSVDSGLDIGSRPRVGSQGSNLSTKGYSLSPSSYRRCQPQLTPQEKPSLVENVNSITDSEISLSLQLVNFPETESMIVSSAFRGTNILITASQDGYVHVTDLDESMSLHGQENTSSTTVGMVDVWKKYLAIGFPQIKVVDLDTKEKRPLLSSSSIEGDNIAQFVTFTPEGQLLSYKSESYTIHVWPHITSLWSNMTDYKLKADLLVIDGAQEIQSLSVSPNPDESLIAVVIRSKDLDERKLRIYNYKTKEMKREVKLNESAGKPIIAFHPYAKYVAVGNGQSLLFYVIENETLLQPEEFADDDHSINVTSLCFYPTGSHLTIGLSSGEVKSYKGFPSSPQPVASHSKPGLQAIVSVTSITYSKDCSILSVGYSNGKVCLWQVPPLSMPMVGNNRDVQLLREKEMKVTSNGAQFVSQDDGYIISVQPGVVSKGSSLTLKHGVVPHGAFHQFEFPKGAYPVSAILWVQSTSKQEFRKPIDIALPHFISCETLDDGMKLAIFKACHVTDVNGIPKYRFEEMPKKNMSLFTVQDKKVGVVLPYAAYSSDHCCFWCVGTYFKSDTEKAMFCLTEAKPKYTEELDSRECNIHFCLSYYLPTCLNAVKGQFPCSEYDLKHLAVTFPDERDPAMSVQFESEINGWSFSLQGGDKIYKKDLYFWDYVSCSDLVKIHNNRQYPPRFILKVDGHGATKSINTRVAFPGVKEYFKRTTPSSDIKLKFHPQGVQHSTPRRLLLSSTSDSFTPGPGMTIAHQHPFQSAMANFTDVQPVKLAFYLFTQGVINLEDYETTKKSANDQKTDAEELNMEILVKAYRVLNSNPQKINGICSALKKLKNDEAQKLAGDCDTYEKERTKFSRSGSAETSSSFLGGGYASAHERLSDPEIDPIAVAANVESGGGGDNHDSAEQSGAFERYNIPVTESTPLPNSSSHLLTNHNTNSWITCTTSSIIERVNLEGIAPFLSPVIDPTGNEMSILDDN